LLDNFSEIHTSPTYLPITLYEKHLEKVFRLCHDLESPALGVVTGTKPDFYKQAPLVTEAVNEGIPTFVIETGQHYDNLLGHGMQEFGIDGYVACNLNIRGDLMEKASELLLKFATFGRMCRRRFPTNPILPIVHGDTLVAGITPLSWLFGMGQKVAQNEAGLRSMSPVSVRSLNTREPDKEYVKKFVNSQLEKDKWFLTRDEPFPEQVDTWVCSSGTEYFFAPTPLNKDHLIREGYPSENIFVVGNSVVDAIDLKRKQKSATSIFETYPILAQGSSGNDTLRSTLKASTSSPNKRLTKPVSRSPDRTINDELVTNKWIRVDIHRRENLTEARFMAIIKGVIELVKLGYRVLFIKLTATEHALQAYGLSSVLDKLSITYPQRFIQTPLWQEYAHVVEFLDSGSCWLELTDSGSMQEELLYFPHVKSLTVRLNTDRPETIFEACSNFLVPPVHFRWIIEMVELAYSDKLHTSSFNRQVQKNARFMYGRPGSVSTKIIKIIRQKFESRSNFYPWLHHRLRICDENAKFESFESDFSYL
jgi:UDP-N-acetylglucosamine 2-epimerase